MTAPWRASSAALRERGLYDDAVIVFTSDHGEMNGRRALVDKGVYLYPDVLRVPFAIKLPGNRHGEVETPVSHLDISPTVLEMAGIEPAERQDGISLAAHLRGEEPRTDRELLFECGWHTGVNFACATQRWDSGGHWLYTYNLASEMDELYDLNAVDAANQGRRQRVRAYGDGAPPGRHPRARPALDRLLAQLPHRSLRRAPAHGGGRLPDVPPALGTAVEPVSPYRREKP